MLTCPICSKELKQLHGSHIKQHNLTTAEFKKIYPCISMRNEAGYSIQQQKKLQSIERDNIKCLNCNKLICDSHRRQKRFCNSSCAASYNNTKKLKQLKICQNCNKQYSSSCKQSKYCSHNCSSKVRQREEVDIKCNNCEILFKKKKSKLKRSIKHFCTNTCKQVYYRNNPYERGVYSGHNGKSAVVSYRIKAFENYEHKCFYCNYNRYVDVLQVHHIDENRNNNTLENLRIVCPTCHAEVHKHYR